MANITNKKTKERLKKVIHVLYPEYKHITVKKDLSVVLSKKAGWLSRLFSSKDRIGYRLLTLHYLPQKLSLLKYNNSDFLSTVIEEVTSTEMRKEDVILYFYKEIIKIKYPHVFKELVILPETMYFSDDECERPVEVDFEFRRSASKVNKVTKQTFLTRLYCHPLYYEWMVLYIVSAVVLTYLIFFYP